MISLGEAGLSGTESRSSIVNADTKFLFQGRRGERKWEGGGHYPVSHDFHHPPYLAFSLGSLENIEPLANSSRKRGIERGGKDDDKQVKEKELKRGSKGGREGETKNERR